MYVSEEEEKEKISNEVEVTAGEEVREESAEEKPKETEEETKEEETAEEKEEVQEETPEEKEEEASQEETKEEAPEGEPAEETRTLTELPKPVDIGDELDVTIESVGAKGDGIAKKDGFVIFIAGVQKGENVRIKIAELKTSFAIGEKV